MEQKQAEEKLKSIITEIVNSGLVPIVSVLIDDGYRYVEITERDVSVIMRDDTPFAE